MGQERRTIRYNSIGLFLSEETAASPVSQEINFFNRVQSAQLSIDVAREDVTQIGSEDFLARKIVSAATTTLNFDYLLTDGYEEKTLGLNLAAAGQPLREGTIYSGIKEDKNAFLVIGDEAFNLTGYANRPNGYSGADAIGIGNCFITDYNITAGVGDVAKASVTMVGSNTVYSCIDEYTWIALANGTEAAGIPFPSLNLAQGGTEISGAPIGGITNPGTGIPFDPTIYKSPVLAISPGGINVRIKNLNIGGPIISGYNAGTCTKGAASIQNFDISLPFAREDLRGLGSMHVYGRKMKFPQVGTISFSILSSAFETGNFRDLFCDDEEYQIEIDLNNYCDFTCVTSNEHETFMRFVINNAKLEGYSLNESIGSFSAMDCRFTFGISRNNGFFMSGSCLPPIANAPMNLSIADANAFWVTRSPSNLNIAMN